MARTRDSAINVIFHGGKIKLHAGDCVKVLCDLPEASIDAVVTDPPYHLTSIVKRFSKNGYSKSNLEQPADKDLSTVMAGSFRRLAKGFMGKVWDGGDIAFRPELWAEVLRVLKPGGHMVCFGGTRTYHRMVCAIEDAGFEIRDQLAWVYGSGFPKSHDIAKQIGRGEGFWRGRAGAVVIKEQPSKGKEYERTDKGDPITEAARQWQGWGTALKPAFEPICLARKPLSEGTVAANVLRWGTGAINIDGCRISSDSFSSLGRWPANLCHDGSPEVLAGFPDSSAARFFYTAKADWDDRLDSKHPTVKPVDLMQWLVRLVCPKGGLVLDPFAGTGTTGAASFIEGCRCVLIEREAEYLADIERRMELLLSGPDERARKLAKPEPIESLPLFGAL